MLRVVGSSSELIIVLHQYVVYFFLIVTLALLRIKRDEIDMSNQVLLGFLKAGLLELNSDDTKLEKLQDAARDLAGILKKRPKRQLRFA